MNKETHLLNLREQYVNVSRQYLDELEHGHTVQTVKDLKLTIETLVREIDEMEEGIEPYRKVHDLLN